MTRWVFSRNFLQVLLKFGVVLIVLIVFSDLVGQWYRHTSQFQRLDTMVRMGWLQVRIRFSLQSEYEVKDFYDSVRIILERNGYHYEARPILNAFVTSEPVDMNEPICRTKCRDFVLRSRWSNWYVWNNNQVARWYYEAGLLSFEEKDLPGAEYFFEISRRLSPEWSFVHLELANIYMLQNQAGKAIEILDECKQFTTGENYCLNMCENINKNMYINQTVGFLSDKMRKNIPY